MKAWMLRHWLVTGMCAMVAGAGIGGGIATATSGQATFERRAADLAAALAETREDLADAERATSAANADRLDLEDTVSSLEDRLSTIDQEWGRLRARNAELSELRESLNARAARVEQASRRVAELERKLQAELHRVRTSTITEGTWQIGVDIEPGVYRARGGSLCYWAILNSLDNFDIANNGGFTANQTVQLTSGWFESRDCGEWKKIG